MSFSPRLHAKYKHPLALGEEKNVAGALVEKVLNLDPTRYRQPIATGRRFLAPQ